MTGKVCWLGGEGYSRYREIEWWQLVGGDTIYYRTPRCRTHAHGPFVVVDPDTRCLMSSQGVRFSLPDAQPLYLEREGESWPPV